MRNLSIFKWHLVAAVVAISTGITYAQVGVGTDQPQAMLHVHDGSILSTSVKLAPENNPYFDPSFPDSVEYKMKWFHDKGAFRSLGERVESGGFESQLIGKYSFGSGFEIFATGVGSTAFGLKSTATGTAAFASGENSFATGYCSFAHGYSVTASGANSVAFGTMASTDGKSGSFAFGDNTSNKVLKNDANNQMAMRFSGGYHFFTNSGLSAGVQLQPGGNSWVVLSDVRKKENFSPVDGEKFLEKIKVMKLTSWNYKGQDPKTFRHYGPMAQDFFKAFGSDEYGQIGTDTTINQADLQGVNLIAIQALVKRTEQLHLANKDLLAEIAGIKAQIAVNEQHSDFKKRKRHLFAGK
jgi:hypothetical protein